MKKRVKYGLTGLESEGLSVFISIKTAQAYSSYLQADQHWSSQIKAYFKAPWAIMTSSHGSQLIVRSRVGADFMEGLRGKLENPGKNPQFTRLHGGDQLQQLYSHEFGSFGIRF